MQVDRIVVVGCGSIGRRHARVLASREDVALELCEPLPENLDRARTEVGKVPVHRSFEDMLRTSPQMVIIATPHSVHAEQTVAALQAGAHVLCEKPMSDTVAGAQRMLHQASQCNRVLDVGFTLRFHPALLHIKQLIDSGELGRILHIHWHVGTYQTLLNSVSRHQSSTFGALMMDYSHQPDLINWWLGTTPTQVYASGCFGEHLPLVSRPNVLAVTLQFEQPTIATIGLNYVQQPERCSCEVIGDRAWVLLDMKKGLLVHGRREDDSISERLFNFERDELFRAEHEAFINATRGIRPVESPPEKAIKSMYVVEAAITSLQTGTPISLSAECELKEEELVKPSSLQDEPTASFTSPQPSPGRKNAKGQA